MIEPAIPPVLDPHRRTSYRICRRCVMDTTDPELTFGDDGICHRCRTYDNVIAQYVHAPEEGKRLLDGIANQIRAAGAGQRYDCIIGLSGGVDSSYVAMLVKDLGLRPLAIHVDNGWNTEAAVRNIQNVVKKLGIDLFTIVIDWEEFRDLQKAFLFSSTPDCEIPSDHAIVSALYHAAVRERVRYIILGSNFQTEQMVPRTWSTGHGDWKYISTINERFGGRRLKTFPHNSLFYRKWWYPKVKKIDMVLILNYVEYDKRKAMAKIRERIGWVEYGDKHHESIYTRFYQTYILPKKFGVDKRRPHLSSLINNGEMARDEALAILQRPPLDEEQLEQDRRFVIKKLGLTEADFDRIMSEPPKSFWQYPNYENSPPVYDRLLTRAIQMPAQSRSLAYRALSLAYAVARRPYRLAKKLLGRG